MTEKEKTGFGDDAVKGLLLILAYGHAACLTPITRKGAGSSAMGIPVFTAALLYWFWIMGTRSEAIIGFGLAWMVCVVFHRIQRLKAEGHSWYVGYPVFTGWLVHDERWARVLEGGILVVFGLMFEVPLHPVSHFLMLCGVSIVFIEALMWKAARKRIVAVRDAEIEAMQLGRR